MWDSNKIHLTPLTKILFENSDSSTCEIYYNRNEKRRIITYMTEMRKLKREYAMMGNGFPEKVEKMMT